MLPSSPRIRHAWLWKKIRNIVGISCTVHYVKSPIEVQDSCDIYCEDKVVTRFLLNQKNPVLNA